MRLSVERAVSAGLWTVLATLAVLSATDYFGTVHFMETAEKVDHAYQVLEKLDRLLAEMINAETGQRGYLITGAPRYLEPYDNAIGRVAGTLETLRGMTAPSETQRRRIEGLAPLVTSRLASLKETMDVRTRDGFGAARRVVLTDRGKNQMDAIRKLVGDMATEERRILADRSSAAHRSARTTILIVLFGDAAALAFAGACHVVARRGLAARRRHEAATEAARRVAQDASRFKSEFLANVSHEIRTPMSAILGYAELLAERDAGQERCVEYLDVIRRNGDHLLAVLNDILDLSKIEAGRLVIERAPCSPFALVSDVTSLMRSRADEKGLVFEVAYRGPIPETIVTDATRVRQVLINLVGNAIKFTPAGAVRVELALEGSPPRLAFAIVDTGIGLTVEQQARVFDAFTQADASTARRYGGTGLGLTISKRLAEALGGELAVVGSPGRGCTFTLRIDPGPLEGVALRESPPPDVGVRPSERGGPMRLAGRVLLAEDDADARRLVTLYLRAAGADVTTASDGAAACELAAAAAASGTPFDIVVMDMHMPRLDGEAAAIRLRAEGCRAAIIALTAHARGTDRDRLLAAGCDAFATKPIRRDALLELVRHHLTAAAGTPIVSEMATDHELAGVLAAFVHRLPERLAAMERAVATADLGELASLAHQIRGVARGYGFPSITEAATALEGAARSGQHVERRLAELAALCRRATADPGPR